MPVRFARLAALLEERAGAGARRAAPERSLAAMRSALPILTFHALDDAGGQLAFPPIRFAEGLAALAAAGWRALPLTELIAALDAPAPLPERVFAITFDDGYRTVFDHAVPLLERLAMPATVFVALGSEAPSTNGRLAPMEGRERLAWSEIREMRDRGVEFGCHTLTHPDLTRISTPEIETELRVSKARLEEALSRPVRSFAYPYGRFDRRSREVASRLYDCAVSDRLGLAQRSDDRHALPRVETYYLRGRGALAGMSRAGFGAYLAVRNAPRTLRRLLRAR